MKQVSEVKHRNCIITSTPTEQFPNMVTIIKAPKIRSSFLNSRYINIERKEESKYPPPPIGGRFLVTREIIFL